MLERTWHHELHATDKIVTFPPDLVMVYRFAAPPALERSRSAWPH